jgi:hypothetical protein
MAQSPNYQLSILHQDRRSTMLLRYSRPKAPVVDLEAALVTGSTVVFVDAANVVAAEIVVVVVVD